MSDVDLSEFLKLSRPKKPPCPVGVALEQLKPGERRKATAAIGHDAGIITNQAVALWFKARQLDVSWQHVSAHRRGQCNCDG